MKETKEKACAKLNISLDVRERRSDGYHNMVMVMQTVSLCDDVRISLNSTGTVRAGSNLRFIPGDDRNLGVRAAKRYLLEIGEEGIGADIEIQKRIPVGAGLGGGSADAAAVLRGMNRLFDGRLTAEELLKISEDVGSDVPFCVRGGTALAEGRGEILRALPPVPDCIFVICKPEFSISTPELFRELDRAGGRRHPDTDGIINGLEAGDLQHICRRMYNVFEDVDDRRMRTVAEIKSRLLDFGAMGAVMTGTGSAVFGVMQDEEAAEAACRGLKKDYGFCAEAKPAAAVLP
jgi:4-diphosphocytidyl-2-C-methyl-D-erythritol kinase